MPKKVHELAIEMGLTDKELISKLQELGYTQRAGSDILEDIDAVVVKNAIANSRKKAETKIVKASVKKESAKESDEVKVKIKAVDKAIIEAQAKKSNPTVHPKESAYTQRSMQAPPVGKPVPRDASTVHSKFASIGKPMPKNAVPQKKANVPQDLDKSKAEANLSVESAEPIKGKQPEEESLSTRASNQTEELVLKEEKQASPHVAKAENKEPEIQPEKLQKPEEKKHVSADAKTEKKKEIAEAPKKPAEKIDYTPGIGLKIVRRAEDEPKPAPRKAPERKPVSEKNPRDYAESKRSGEKEKQARPAKGSEPGKKKEESNGRADRAPHDSAFSKKDQSKKKKTDSKDRVLVYTAPVGDVEKKGRKAKGKDKDKDGKSKYTSKPLDLTKSTPKKHRKYKDKNDIVEENSIEEELLPEGSVVISVPISVAGFCEQIDCSSADAIMALMKMGIMANINQNLDEETAILLGVELGINVVVSSVEEDVVEEGIELFEDKAADLISRAPIVAVMGHVDHGKTSLLDAIRKTNVTDSEAGGITQHIGASEIDLDGQKIVFLDTPGHEAFTAMRARGAHVTDIAVLVVAADDSVKPQTIESISHAKAAGVPIIVAINKMDKPGADTDRVKKDLSEQGLLVEDWGGDVICVPVSAKTGDGIIQVLEMILLQAEILELKANPNRFAMGTVIEARLDRTLGPVATLLVTNGTIKTGMPIVAGTCSGKIRAMTNSKKKPIQKAGPARAVEITGLTEVPQAGDEFNCVKEDKTAREIAEQRKLKVRGEVLAKNSSITLEQLFSQIEEGEVKELNLILKADVMGSVGALEQSLEKLHNENVKVKIIHSGVGTVTESDIMLASTSKAVIIGFNVRPNAAITAMADREKVEIRTYRIIYEIIDDIQAAIKGMLDPIFKEVVMGTIQVRETFKVPGAGIIAGAYVTDGKVSRNAKVRLVRDGIVIHEGVISSLKRYKDDVKEVATGFECGIGLEKYNDIKEGDIIEAFAMVEIERK